MPETSGAEKLVPMRRVEAVGVDRPRDAGDRRDRPGIARRHDRIEACASAGVDAVAARRGDRDLRAEVGEADLVADVAQRRDADRAGAARRAADGVAAAVAGGGDDDRAGGVDAADRVDVAPALHAATPPRLMLRTRAGVGLAGSFRPSAQPAMPRCPEHAGRGCRSRSRRTCRARAPASARTVRPTLAMPTPLLVVAPIRPAVWVPCQLLLPMAQSAAREHRIRLIGRGDAVARIGGVAVAAIAVVGRVKSWSPRRRRRGSPCRSRA